MTTHYSDGAEDKPLQFFPVDIGRYRHHPPLDTGAEVDGVAALLEPFGARTDRWHTPQDERGADAVEERLRNWSALRPEGDSFLYWVSHGSSDGGPTALLAHARSPRSLTHSGVSPQVLLHYLRNRQGRRDAGWAIVVIDACTSARFVELMSAHAHLNPGAENFLLVATSKDGSTTLGAFRRALTTVLSVTFRAQDAIDLRDLANELNRNLHGSPAIAHTDTGQAILRRTWPTLAGSLQVPLDLVADIESVLGTMTDDERRHFLPKASGAELGEQTWYFEGRDTERHTILSWLDTSEEGMLVVTGAAGSGKSALLGHVLVHTRPELRGALIRGGRFAPLPPGTPQPTRPLDAALHLTGATPQDLVARIATAAGFGLPPIAEPIANQSAWLLKELRIRHTTNPPSQPRPQSQRLTLLVDALDEARMPLVIADQILRPLAAIPGVRVIVGTRSSTREEPDLPAPAEQNLLAALGALQQQGQPHMTVLTLGRDNQAMTRYIRHRLTAAAGDGRIPPDLARLSHTATALGSLDREFLYARLAVHEIINNPALAEDPTPILRSNHRQLFARAVARLSAQAPVNRQLLEALAVAQGHGLPLCDGIWATAAAALASTDDSNVPITDSDIAALTETAAPYLMLDIESGQSVYRLAHRTFVEHFAHPAPAPRYDSRHYRITKHLTTHTDARLPSAPPNPYIVDHLPAHTALAGPAAWQILANHPRLLDRLSPAAIAGSAMLNAFGRFQLPPAIAGVVASQRVLATASRHHRRGIRELATTRSTGQTVPSPRIKTQAHEDQEAAWSVRWARLRRYPIHLTLKGHTSTVSTVVAFAAPDGRTLLATGGEDWTVRIWDPTTGHQVGQLNGHTDWVRAMAVFTASDGRTLLATGSNDRTVRIWDPEAGGQTGRLSGHADWVRAVVAFAAPGGLPLLATGSADRTVRIWDPATGHQIRQLNGHTRGVRAVVAFAAPDGRPLLAIGGEDRAVQIWDPATGHRIGHLNAHTRGVQAVVAFAAPHGRPLLATGSEDRGVRIWDPAAHRQIGQLNGHTHAVSAIAVFAAPGGRPLLATSSHDRTVRVWDPTTGHGAGKLNGHDGAVWAVASFTAPDGRPLLATGGEDRAVRIWNLKTGHRAGQLSGHTDWVSAIAVFTAPGERTLLATASHDRTVGIWDPSTGHRAGQLKGHTNWVRTVVAFASPGGRPLLATGSDDKTVRIWDPTTNHQIAQLKGHTGWVWAVASFTAPNGHTLLVSGSDDWTVRIWDPETGRQTGHLPGHTGRARTMIAFTLADGHTLLAIGSQDWTVRIWDPITGHEAGQPMKAHTGVVRAVTAFTARDGRPLLASGSDDGTVQIWDPKTGVKCLSIPIGVSVYGIAVVGTDLVLATQEGVVAISFEPGSGL